MGSMVRLKLNMLSSISNRIVKFVNVIKRNKSYNSSEWLKRHSTDLYVEKAKKQNYRCRSAFKLLEIDNRFKLLKPGHIVLDVGASPGSWSQVLAEKTNSTGKNENSPKGLVIAIDIAFIYPIEGVITLSNHDFTKKASQNKILEILGSRKFDFVFSDMAPVASGVKSLDQENILNLMYPVLIFSIKNLKVGGGLLLKIWQGQHQNFTEEIKRFFQFLNIVKPNSSYLGSSEVYLLGREFLGVK